MWILSYRRQNISHNSTVSPYISCAGQKGPHRWQIVFAWHIIASAIPPIGRHGILKVRCIIVHLFICWCLAPYSFIIHNKRWMKTGLNYCKVQRKVYFVKEVKGFCELTLLFCELIIQARVCWHGEQYIPALILIHRASLRLKPGRTSVD